jgi:ribosomal protein S18 acetylase RimI-like enzyme
MIINTQLNDGTPVCIRRVRREDEARLKDGIAQLSPQSRYLRFFSAMREAPPQVLRTLASPDGHDHIAWGALRSDLPDTPALGVVHAFRDKDDPEAAEYSVAVVDEYHGRGRARLLTAVLLLDCADEGLEQFIVHVLPQNRPALALALAPWSPTAPTYPLLRGGSLVVLYMVSEAWTTQTSALA